MSHRKWRPILILMVVAFVSFATLLHAGVATAQTISTVDLSSVALGDGDVSGFVTASEPVAMVPRGFDAAFTRVLESTDQRGSLLVVNLAAASDSTPASVLSSAVSSGSIFDLLTRNQSDASAGIVANFRTTGPLGAGDVDLSAVWDMFDSRSNSWRSVYADSFVRGRVLATVIYTAPPAIADAAVLSLAVQAQDTKIQTSPNLP